MTDEELHAHFLATRKDAFHGTYQEWEEAHGNCDQQTVQYVLHPRVWAVRCTAHDVVLYWLAPEGV